MIVAAIVAEAWQSTASSLVRNMTAGAGILLASAAFVATTGLSATLSNQVSSTFDAQRATEVLAIDNAEPADDSGELCQPLAPTNVSNLPGVLNAGQYVYLAPQRVGRPEADLTTSVAVAGLDLGAYLAVAPGVQAGRPLDAGYFDRGDNVALVSANTARSLQIDPSGGQAIEILGRSFTVVGSYSQVTRRPEVADAVLIPEAAMRSQFRGAVSHDQVKCQFLAATASGAASGLAENVALALRPNDPSSFTVIAPPDPRTLRQSLEGPVQRLSLALSVLVLLIGGLSVGTSVSSNLTHRRNEIGLRKALGARASAVVMQLLVESAIVGATSALVGVLVGAYVVVGVAFANDWSPILNIWATGLVCVAGAAIGALGGMIPALRASTVSPSVSLRR